MQDDDVGPAGSENATLAGRPSARVRPKRSEAAEAATDSGGSGSRRRSPSVHSSQATAATGLTRESEAALMRVMLDDELTRAHGFSALITLISTAVLCVLPWLGGDPLAKRLCAAALAVIAASSAVVFLKTRPPFSHERGPMRAYGFIISSGVIFVQYYIGMFSPAVVIVTLGVYSFAESADPVQALGLPAWVFVTYVAATLCVTFGVLPDVGLFSAADTPLSSRIFAVTAVSAVLALTARMARLSRASIRTAIARSHEAMLEARKGEALLVEARQHLERALGVAIGEPSHYTGQLAGQYRLGVVVGIGAMGEVYAAEHVESGAAAAVKLMRPSAQARGDLVERFLREGAICAALKNPHLVEVHGVGTMEDGAPYMAMELLRGADLAARLRKEGSLPFAEVVTLAQALADGLHHVHEAGVVHRDLKPVNVFEAELPSGGTRWKILDFGVSKQRASTGTLTDVGVVGTPGYMSPEQARGLPVDHRSDVFAMGVVLYRSLTGRPAFTGNDTPQIMFEVVYKMPERPSEVVRDLPSDVDLVFAIALAKEPRERWATARELADALALAGQRKLPAEAKRRGHAILRSCPWGQPLGAGRSASALHTD